MIALATEQHVLSTHLDDLRLLFESDKRKLDWLVITHDDPDLIRQLSQSIQDDSVAMLPIPQQRWDFQGGQLVDAIRWAVTEARVANLLVVGHSASDLQGVTDRSTDGSIDSSGTKTSPVSSGGLPSGARHAQGKIRACKDDYRQRIAEVCVIDEVRAAMSSASLFLHTLFYVTESRSFLSYDPKGSEFVPLHCSVA